MGKHPDDDWVSYRLFPSEGAQQGGNPRETGICPSPRESRKGLFRRIGSAIGGFGERSAKRGIDNSDIMQRIANDVSVTLSEFREKLQVFKFSDISKFLETLATIYTAVQTRGIRKALPYRPRGLVIDAED